MEAVQIEGTYKPLAWSEPEPRQNFADQLAGLSDDEFLKRAEQLIWLSAFAGNNPRSDYHWQADLCHDESKRRGKPELYRTAWSRAAK